MGDRTRETARLEGMPEDASIKATAVASSLTTASAQAMLSALIAGDRDPPALADLANGRMRVKIPALTEAMIGHFDPSHAQVANVGTVGDALNSTLWSDARRPRYGTPRPGPDRTPRSRRIAWFRWSGTAR